MASRPLRRPAGRGAGASHAVVATGRTAGQVAARERSRRAILDAALGLFCEHGYEGTPISAITDRSGVSHGLVSYYFPAKRDLLVALLSGWLAGMLDAIAALPRSEPDEELATALDLTLVGAHGNLPVQRLMLSLMLQPSTQPVYAAVEAGLTPRLAAADARLRDLFERRGAADPDLEVVMLRSVVEGVLVKLSVYADRYPMVAARTWLYRTYGLGVPAPLPGLTDPPGPPALRPDPAAD